MIKFLCHAGFLAPVWAGASHARFAKFEGLLELPGNLIDTTHDVRSVDACKDLCFADESCHCLTFDAQARNCQKRSECKQVVERSGNPDGSSVYVKLPKTVHDYKAYDDTNSYIHHGSKALVVGNHPAHVGSPTECRELCSADDACDCVVYLSKKEFVYGAGACWLREACVPEHFAPGKGFTVLMKSRDTSGAITDELVKQQEAAENGAKQEKAKQEALEKEKARQEELAKEKAKQEALAKEKARQEALAKEKAKQEELAKEKAKQEAVRKEKARQDKLKKEKAKQEELAKEKAKQEVLQKEKAKQEADKEKATQQAAMEGEAKVQRARKEASRKEEPGRDEQAKTQEAEETLAAQGSMPSWALWASGAVIASIVVIMLIRCSKDGGVRSFSCKQVEEGQDDLEAQMLVPKTGDEMTRSMSFNAPHSGGDDAAIPTRSKSAPALKAKDAEEIDAEIKRAFEDEAAKQKAEEAKAEEGSTSKADAEVNKGIEQAFQEEAEKQKAAKAKPSAKKKSPKAAPHAFFVFQSAEGETKTVDVKQRPIGFTINVVTHKVKTVESPEATKQGVVAGMVLKQVGATKDALEDVHDALDKKYINEKINELIKALPLKEG
eukprot:TRINITY_DN2561_c0_g1_i1.p1 TRINITY_DN2561_c0_g1~~TRINITY_DN2561_c0_g1_i1.p1  ORF type:complete len:610 (-),score=183.21 TRINITY_DN2561_c0_g1_i1:128-1957(-)